MASKINERDVLRRAREVLAHLYPSGSDVKRVIYDAGLDPRRIDLSGSSSVVWFNVLVEAEKTDTIGPLLALALQDYPSQRELQELASMVGVARSAPASPREGYRPRLFLSFHGADRGRVDAVRARLDEAGFEPVTVEESLTLGEDFKVGVLRAVEGSDAAMVFISATSSASATLAEDLRTILRRQKQSGGYLAIPARLDETPLPAELANLAALDLRGFSEGALPEAIASSLDALRERLLLGRSAPQVVETAERAATPLLSYLRRLAAS